MDIKSPKMLWHPSWGKPSDPASWEAKQSPTGLPVRVPEAVTKSLAALQGFHAIKAQCLQRLAAIMCHSQVFRQFEPV